MHANGRSWSGPTVQHRDCTDLCTQTPRIGGDIMYRLARGMGQNGVEQALVWNTISAAATGRVKTTWEYGIGQQLGSPRSEQAAARGKP